MLKKSLTIGSIALLLVMLIALAGCEGPVGPAGAAGTDGTDGDDGDHGLSGGFSVWGPTVTDNDLKAAFNSGKLVIIQSGVTSIYGEVPADGVLQIVDEVRVRGDEELVVKGTLEVLEEGVLLAHGNGTGLLNAESGGKIEGKGSLVLPYALDSGFIRALHYTSPEVSGVTRFPGSVSLLIEDDVSWTSETGTRVNPSWTSLQIAQIFTVAKLDSLRVRNFIGLIPEAIPVGKTLSLYGKGNSIAAANFDLTGTGKHLIVEAPAVLVAPDGAAYTITASGGAEITNSGTITLASANPSFLAPNGGKITNDGFIVTRTNSDAQLETLLKFDGTGSIEVAANVSLTGTTTLRQNLWIAEGITLTSNRGIEPFLGVTSGKTVTIDGGTFNLTATDLEKIGTGVVINSPNGFVGAIQTLTTDHTVLTTIFGEAGNKGRIEAAGAIAPVAATDLVKSFTVPEGITLALTQPASFGTGTTIELIVQGVLDLGGASGSFGTGGDITLGERGKILLGANTLTVAAGKTLVLPRAGSIEGDGLLISLNGRVIANATDAKIEIGTDYFTTLGVGVLADDLGDILEVFAADKAILGTTIPVNTTFGADVAVGIVKLDNNSVPRTVYTEGDGTTLLGKDLKLSSEIYAATLPVPAFVAQQGSATEVPDFTHIGISTIASTIPNEDKYIVQIVDTGYSTAGSGTGSDTFLTVTYSEVKLEYGNLVTKQVDQFKIGVKTRRGGK